MKYNLRFFMQNAKEHSEKHCFASAISKHLPKPGNYIFFNDDMIEDSSLCEAGTIYKVVYRLFCFSKEINGPDDLVSVEIVVKPTNK